MPRAGESIEEWTIEPNVIDSVLVKNHTDSQRPMIHIVHFPDIDPINISDSKKTWKNILHEHLPRESEIFTISDVYEKCEELLSYIFPNNKTIRASIKHNLQRLRDDGIIAFVDYKGQYKWM